MNAGTHQQSQGHQTEGDRCDQRGRGVLVSRRFGGRQGDGVLAASPHVAQWTLAHWAGEMGEAGAAVVAEKLVAGTVAHGAVFASEAQRARTGEVIDSIYAGAGVAAGVTGAVVDVGLTARAGEARPAAAGDLVTAVKTLRTCGEEETGVSKQQTAETRLMLTAVTGTLSRAGERCCDISLQAITGRLFCSIPVKHHLMDLIWTHAN